jgi:chemotaxis protein MotB
MSSRGGRKRRGAAPQHDNEERWLLTYADMITLLMALFMVLFSISAVNVSKFQSLQESLQAAFSGKVGGAGKVMPGGSSVFAGEGARVQGVQASFPTQPATQGFTIFSSEANGNFDKSPAAAREQERLVKLERRAQQYAQSHGFASQIRTSIDERGLVIRLLTDKVLFPSGSATLEAGASPLLGEVAALVDSPGIKNPVRVEGNTDSLPIATAQFHDNWELSTARATAVLEFLLRHGAAPARLSVAGYGSQRPVEPNTTAAGRAANRRVDVILLRTHTSNTSNQG